MSMFRKSTMLAGAVAALLASSGLAVTTVTQSTPPRASVPKDQRERWSGDEPNPRTRRRRTGPGWTHAQVQRMAKKARNRARNRRAHK